MYRSLFVFLAFIPALCRAQIVSVQDGLYSDPATWSCNCVPQGPADIVIDHAVVLDIDLFYGNGPVVSISPGASLIENDPYHITITNGILRNEGTLNVSGLVTSPPFCDVWNYNQMTVSSWFSNGALFFNKGNCVTYHFENYGTVLNIGSTGAAIAAVLVESYNDIHNSGTLTADSMYVQSLFVNSGTCETGALLTHAIFNSSDGTMHVSGNARIEGSSNQGEDSRLNVDGNLVLAGTIHHAGEMRVLGDLVVDSVASLDGTGGICVGGNSHNAGTVSEVYFCDATGSDFDVNTGTIAADVVYCAGGMCELGLEEQLLQVFVSPNPATGVVSVSAAVPVESVELYALTGELVLSVAAAEMTVDGFAPGMYFVGINGNTSGLQRLIVQ